MKSRLVVALFAAAALIGALVFVRFMLAGRQWKGALQLQPPLQILTYSSFSGPTGPGPQVLAQFKEQCQCELKVDAVNDSGLLLERLKILEKSRPVDVVIGLDQYQLELARLQMAWISVPVERTSWDEPVRAMAPEDFIPYDWAPMTFVYRAKELPTPPQQWSDFKRSGSKYRLVLMDPRVSTPGMQFLVWLSQSADAPPLSQLKSQVAQVTPSWSLAYGLFQKGQANLVFSYQTSLAYHWGAEGDKNYQAVRFASGHPIQIEFMGIPQREAVHPAARELVRFLLKPEAQKIIMEKNYMFPLERAIREGTIFASLEELKILPATPLTIEQIQDMNKVWVEAFH